MMALWWRVKLFHNIWLNGWVVFCNIYLVKNFKNLLSNIKKTSINVEVFLLIISITIQMNNHPCKFVLQIG